MKINRNFAKITLLFLFFPTGFNGWNMFLFATDQVATPSVLRKTSHDSPKSMNPTGKTTLSKQEKVSKPDKTTPDSSSSIPDLSEGKEDGLPLYFPGEQKILFKLASWLKNRQDSEVEKLSFGPVSFISLNAKSETFRGKVVQVKGRLLKTRYLPILNGDNKTELQTDSANRAVKGFYESWVLCDDNQQIPLRLWTLSIPEESLVQDPVKKNDNNQLYRRERIQVTGIYYRLTSYYDGTDFRNAPMLIAKNFTITEKPNLNTMNEDANRLDSPQSQDFTNIKIIGVTAVFLAWLAYRALRRRNRRKTPVNKGTTVCILLLGLMGFGNGTTYVWGQTGGIPKSDTRNLKPATSRQADLPRDIPTMLRALGRIQRKSVFWDELPTERRTAFLRKQPVFPDMNEQSDLRYPFRGRIIQVEKISIPGARSDATAEPYYYRCVISTNDAQEKAKRIIVYTSSWPSFQINRLGQLADSDQEQSGVAKESNLLPGTDEVVGGIGFLMVDESRREKCPVLSAAQFGWYPESMLLGRLGMDVASFDVVPVFSPRYIARLVHKDDTESSSVNRQQIMLSLRLTKSDTDAFYGLLLAGSRAGVPQLFREAQSYLTQMENKTPYWPAVELFNRPQKYQGELVLLRGRARRVERIPVGDEDVRKRFGLESYYQIIFFTPDSQGNPMVVCVPQLPQGMPVGSGKQYREEIEVAAFFYKSWAYRGSPLQDERANEPTAVTGQKTRNESLDTSSEIALTSDTNAELSPLPSTDKTDMSRQPETPWVKAPLLVGGSVRWIPQTADSSGPAPASVRWTFTAFAALAFLYFSYRLFRRRFAK